MTSFHLLPDLTRALYGCCAVALMIGALSLLTAACVWHMERRYAVSAAVLSVLSILIIQGMIDVSCTLFHKGSTILSLAKVMEKTPVSVILFLLVLIAAAEGVAAVFFLRRKKNMLTPGAIKESLDSLPDGVCFFAKDGQPLLVNKQMQQLSGELFGTEMPAAQDFWEQLVRTAGTVPADTDADPGITLRTSDGKVWEFRRRILQTGLPGMQEMIACDVTRQYRLRRELEERNRRLTRIHERLHRYNLEVERIAAEKEVLNAKIQVHDDVGRTLLAFRSYLAQPEESRNRESLLTLWRQTVSALKNEAAPDEPDTDCALLHEAAQSVGVTLVCDGQMPEDETAREILTAAIHECLTNTVKHAGGDKLYCTVRSDETFVSAQLRNNGRQPTGEIQETGGLGNLRYTVESAGGTMRITSTPQFLLHIRVPKGGADLWQKPES